MNQSETTGAQQTQEQKTPSILAQLPAQSNRILCNPYGNAEKSAEHGWQPTAARLIGHGGMIEQNLSTSILHQNNRSEVDLCPIFDQLNTRFFAGKLPSCVLEFGELPPNQWGAFRPIPRRITVNSCLVDRPKAVKLTIIHECLHLWIDATYPIKQQRGGSHHSPAWFAECRRIGWLMGQPANVWKQHPQTFPLWVKGVSHEAFD